MLTFHHYTGYIDHLCRGESIIFIYQQFINNWHLTCKSERNDFTWYFPRKTDLCKDNDVNNFGFKPESVTNYAARSGKIFLDIRKYYSQHLSLMCHQLWLIVLVK